VLPFAFPDFLTSVPFSGLADGTVKFKPDALDESAEVGAIGAGFFLLSLYVIYYPLA
jgi:hypothetical protein